MNFKSPDWVQDAIFYQIFPDRFYNGNSDNDSKNICKWRDMPTRDNFFGGDLEGIICKLPYLEELGVNALYLNPIFKSPSNHKYNTTDYYKIDPIFGNKDVFKRLVKEFHRRGIRIILDGVFNHCGDTFWAFQDVIEKGPKSKYKDWFIIKSYPIVKQPEPNYRCWMGTSSMPEFNTDNPEVREYLLKVVKYWIKEADIDGWRLDTVEYMDPSFVKQIRETAKEVKKDAYVMGEVMGVATSWFKSKSLDAVMNYKLRDLIIDFFIKKVINAVQFNQQLYNFRQTYSDLINPFMFNLLDSHDVPRFLTLCGGNVKKMKLAAAFLMTYIGAPVIYYGDEVGMMGGEDPDCRRTMIWNKNQQNIDLLNLYKKIIKLRRESLALRRGNFKCLYQQGGLYCFSRQLNEEKIVVALNNSDKNEEINISLPEIETGKRLKVKDIFTGAVDPLIINQNEHNLKVTAHDFKILSVSI
ncbi:MAG: glycoside hydrolase family 13 protein [Candidatus Atribacteria bacterium]|jgi:glycosidase|nr:glycoside hydrolase family 13 protein [Candidatus Atribacteria bacterium]